MLKLITNPVGVATLAKREIVRFMVVAVQTIFPPWISSLMFMYIFGIAIGSQVSFPITGMTYLQFIIPGLMTMHLISSSYENTSASLFIGRWHNNIQEVLLSPLSYFEMVLGLLAGGITRGMLICVGVFGISQLFIQQSPIHPFVFLYFSLMISTVFSCAGLLAALWAEDFGMVNLWNVYLIVPAVLLGGVFHPLAMLPKPLQILSHFNPIHYLMSGMRYAVIGYSDQNIFLCAILAFVLAISFGCMTVWLFKKGYKLRT
ncbi:MAG: ABC transporter permease [Candidatus Omnitrophica bacterium]|nr:ABC transporter permease [Candidatus Omnitrophota bacterium]